MTNEAKLTADELELAARRTADTALGVVDQGDAIVTALAGLTMATLAVSARLEEIGNGLPFAGRGA